MKTALVTGATSGIGLATALDLALLGWRVVIHGRTPEKCQAAADAVRAVCAEDSGGRPAAIEPELAPCDLASLPAVRTFAANLQSRFNRIDALVNNAGVFTSRRIETADGYEMQFAVNHLASYLLTRELLPLLEAAPNGRVVMVSSGSHRSGRIHWRNLQLKRFYFGLTAYGQSKLANVLFAFELQRRLSEGSRVDSFAMEPGLVNTDMGEKRTSGVVNLVWSRRKRHGVSPAEGASTAVMLATDEELQGRGGSYWARLEPTRPSGRCLDEADASRLWEVSARMCALSSSPIPEDGAR